MKRNIRICVVIFILITIVFILETGNIVKVNQKISTHKKLLKVLKKPRIIKAKSRRNIRTPVKKIAVIPEIKQIETSILNQTRKPESDKIIIPERIEKVYPDYPENPDIDEIVIPKTVKEVYADYLEGYVVGKKNLGSTKDSNLDECHFYLYIRTITGNTKMCRTVESKYNTLANGDRIFYRKTKDDYKVIIVPDDKWK